MEPSYNSEDYKPECKSCGVNEFKRERNYFEREYLVLEDDGSAYVDSSDMEGPIDEWVYSCSNCGLEAGDLEDLLDDKPWEDEETEEW